MASRTPTRTPPPGTDGPNSSEGRDAGQNVGRRRPERGEAGQGGRGLQPPRGDISQPDAADRARDPGSRDTAANRRKGSQQAQAADHHAGSGDGWPSWPHPALLSPVRPSGDVRSPVMEDMLAVAQRRKRQLGFDTKPEQ
jgi:hypothetical protein